MMKEVGSWIKGVSSVVLIGVGRVSYVESDDMCAGEGGIGDEGWECSGDDGKEGYDWRRSTYDVDMSVNG